MKIGIDPGKYQTNAVTKFDGKWRYFNLRSKFTINPDNIIMGNNFLIEHNGITTLVGDGGKDYSLDTDKQSLQHMFCSYIAIEQLIGEKECKAVLGCPFNHWKNTNKREEYRNYMYGDGIIQFNLNEEESLINIEEIIPFPECGGIAYHEPEEDFVDTTRAVLDIGGLNATGCIFENLNPVEDSDFTEKLGSIILMDKIRTDLNKEFFEIDLQEHDIKGIFKNGLKIDGKRIDRADKIIENAIEEHFLKIIKIMKKKNWSIKTLDITIGGGGSLDIGIEIIKKFLQQSKLCSDPIWGNAKGNYNVAEMLFG